MPTIIKNGRNYSGTSVSLTQAEYDALPEITKMNGTTYFITDSDVVLDADNVALGNGTVEDLAGSVAVIETETASANRSVGDHILLNGQLYTVTTAVATGETYVVGTNISATTVGSELTALTNDLTPRQLGITAGTNVTLGSQNAVYALGGFIYLSVKGKANAAINNAVIASIVGEERFIYPTTFPIGIGSEWNITKTGYGFLNARNITASLASGEWFHIVATIPYAPY